MSHVIGHTVLDRLTKLGVTWAESPESFTPAPPSAAGVSFYHAPSGIYWSRVDPQGQITEIPAAVCFMLSVRSEHAYRGRWSYHKIELIGASEGYDSLDTRGRRRVLVAFAMDELSQHMHYFDLFDTSDAPRVWESTGNRDSDGNKIFESRPLRGWLDSLRRR